jgi:2-phospho-L-lactate/phosphoenolpyruvate guanylyltransferase
MPVFAVVPVKKLADSKRRLSTVFTPHERRVLTLAMLEDVLNTLKVSNVDKIVLIGEDKQVTNVAESFGAVYLEIKGANLNSAIDEASSFCVQEGASSVLVLPSDIPLIDSQDVNRIVQLAGSGGKAVVISPSHNWGTNALCQNPPKLVPACFGSQSFLNHVREAYQRGVSVKLHFSHGLASDIDSAEDLIKLHRAQNGTVTQCSLNKIIAESKIVRDFFEKEITKKEK